MGHHALEINFDDGNFNYFINKGMVLHAPTGGKMIYFPWFNLSFSIHSIAFELFGIPIYFYAICIIIGIIVAMGLCYQSKEKFGIRT